MTSHDPATQFLDPGGTMMPGPTLYERGEWSVTGPFNVLGPDHGDWYSLNLGDRRIADLEGLADAELVWAIFSRGLAEL